MSGRSPRRHPKPKKRKGSGAVVWIIGLALVLALGGGYLWRSWKARPSSLDLPLFEERILKETRSPAKSEHPGRSLPAWRQAPPRVAIVIDDLGYQKQVALDFINLGYPITLSFLPQAPFSQEMARQALQKGKEILLHLPMEPQNYPENEPGPGALMTGMTTMEVNKVLEKDLAAIPGITGVNNHMGSRFTEDRDKMAVVLKTIRGKGLFFLDSRTTPHSVVFSVASQLGVKALQRDLFLDNVLENGAIGRQLGHLIRLAQEQGSAIACGHPYPQTLQALREKLPELNQKVRLIPLSHFL